MNKSKEKIIQSVTNTIIENIDDIFILLENENPIPILKELPEEHKNDPEIMLGIMEKNPIGPLLCYCSDRLKHDVNFVYEALKIEERNFEQAPVELQNNKEFVLKCIQLPKFLIEDAPEQFLDDKDCAIAAIKRKGRHALEVISDRLKDDIEVAIAAIAYEPRCYRYISERLQNTKEVVLLALSDDGLIEYIPKIYKDDKEVMSNFLETKYLNPQHQQHLQYVSQRLQNDPDIVISALKKDGRNLEFADKKFRENKDLALWSIKNNGSIEFLSKELKEDKEIVLLAIKNSGSQLEFVGEEFKNDKDIVLLACKDNVNNLQYASLEIREEIGMDNPVHFIESQRAYENIDSKVQNKEESKTVKRKL